MDTQFLLPVLIMAVAVAAASASLLWLLTDPQTVQRRLSNLAVAPGAGAPAESVIGEAASPFARRVRSFVPKSPKEMGRVERLLAAAGYMGAWPAIVFSVTEIALPSPRTTWSAMTPRTRSDDFTRIPSFR